MKLRALALTLLSALLPAQDRFRLADPQALSATGSGWSVEPRLGALSLTIPVATVPGELPIPVSLSFAAQFKSQRTEYWRYDFLGRLSYHSSQSSHHPILATQHFGFIRETGDGGAMEPRTFVLEEGLQFRQDDLVAYADWTAKLNPPVSNFALPEEFGLLAMAKESVMVHAAGAWATYGATADHLGSWKTKVQGALPAGYTLSRPTEYQVVMDKDRARVYHFVSEFKAWVPLLWADRYGHFVSFQWSRGTSNLPAGVTAIHSVKALNQRNLGLQLQWAQFAQPFPETEQDLLRTDFIGLPAPAMLVRGYPGWSSLKPAGFTPTASNIEVFRSANVPGPLGRPTLVQMGAPADVPVPSWQGAAEPLPAAAPIPAPMTTELWRFGYDANRAALASFTEANGTVTTFTCARLEIPMPLTREDRPEGLEAWSVSAATSTDATGVALRRDWNRTSSANGEPVVTTREVFGDLESAPKKIEYTYAAMGDDIHYGNGALLRTRVLSGNGEEWSRTTFGLVSVGLRFPFSRTGGQTVERKGEVTRGITQTMDPMDDNLSATSTTLSAGSPLGIFQVESLTQASARRERLEPPRPVKTVATRYAEDGTAKSPARTAQVDYDALGRPVKSSVDGGALGQFGEIYAYDADGRIQTQTPWSSLGSAFTWQQQPSYDPATGQVSALVTAYADGTATKQLTRSFSSFDAFGRPRALTDARGVSTTVTYDARGRALTVQKAGEAMAAYAYPDAFTRTVTVNGATTTERRDGFGRVTSVQYPDGRTLFNGYDSLGRLQIQRILSGNDGFETPTSLEYDLLDRPTARTAPNGSRETLGYEAEGLLNVTTRTVDTAGLAAVTKEWRDPLGQVVKSLSPNGTTTASTFDGLGNVLQVLQTPASGSPVQTRSFAYDALGRLISKTEPETGTTEFRNFNAAGQPTLIREGVVIGDKDSSAQRERVLTYDALGRLSRMQQTQAGMTSDVIASATYGEWFDSDPRMRQDFGRLSRLTFGSGAYDEWSTRTKDTETKDWVLGFKDAAGTLQTTTFAHAFNSAGQITQAGEWSLLHDKENRLLSASAPALGVQTTHGYDAFNNAISARSSAGGDPVLPTFDLPALADNRVPGSLLSGLPTGWSYNALGEAQTVGSLDGGGALQRTQGITWDGLGRLSRISENGQTLHQVTYAPSGLRIRVVNPASPSQSRRYAYTAGGLLLGEYGDDGTWKRDVLYFGGLAVAEVDATATHELHADHLGTPRIITNGVTARIEGQQAYGPYGERLTGASVQWGYQPLTGYTGHVQSDPTGLIYMRGRYYSPQWRHFLNSDQGVDPESWNQMTYVGGSPFQAVDPSGMSIVVKDLGGGKILLQGPAEEIYAYMLQHGMSGSVPGYGAIIGMIASYSPIGYASLGMFGWGGGISPVATGGWSPNRAPQPAAANNTRKGPLCKCIAKTSIQAAQKSLCKKCTSWKE